jgi:hypothetical protein
VTQLQAYSEVRYQPQQQFESDGVGLPLFIVTLAKIHGASSSPSPHLRRYANNCPRRSVTVNGEPWQRPLFTSIRPLWDSAIHEQLQGPSPIELGCRAIPPDPSGVYRWPHALWKFLECLSHP